MVANQGYLKQKYPWSCITAAFALGMGVSESYLHNIIGHNGSEELWKRKKGHWRNRGFHSQECMMACLELRKPVYALEGVPNWYVDEKIVPVFSPASKLVDSAHRICSGVLTGELGPRGSGHAVVWDHERQLIIDPNGTEYPPKGDIVIERFFVMPEAARNIRFTREEFTRMHRIKVPAQ